MSDDKSIKLFKAAKELNIGTGTIVGLFSVKGLQIEKQPNAKIEGEMYDALLKEFQNLIKISKKRQNRSVLVRFRT